MMLNFVLATEVTTLTLYKICLMGVTLIKQGYTVKGECMNKKRLNV